MKQNLVTISEYARSRKLNRSTIWRQVRSGAIPVRDGKIDPKEADRARRNNVSTRHRADYENFDLAGLVDCDPAKTAYRRLFDEILSKRHLVPALLAELGVRDLNLLHCSDDLFSHLVLGLSGGLDGAAYDWPGDDIPLVETPIAAVFKKHGMKITKVVIDQADKMADQAAGAIERACARKAAE